MNQKGHAFLIVLLIAAVIGGYLVYSGKISLNKKQIATQFQSIPASSSSGISNSKTYTNTKYGFSLNYPSNLYIRADSKDDFIGFLEKSNENQSQKLIVSVLENPQDMDLQQFAESKKPIPDDRININYEKSKIYGYSSLIIRDEIPCLGLCENVKVNKGYTVYVKGNKFIIAFNIDSKNPGGVTADDEMWLNGIVHDLYIAQDHFKYPSPDGSYVVTETHIYEYNPIAVRDKEGNIIVDDLLAKNSKEIGYNVKFGCMCTTSFKNWISGDKFTIKIGNGNGEEYEYTVDAKTGKVDESSFKRIK